MFSTPHGQALFDETLAWTRQWWDPEVALLWNPDGAFVDLAPGRSLHQVPNTAWFAWALLATGDPADERDACSAIEALLALQYDLPGSVAHGTFRRFLEWPERLPDDPVMWEDYDPNWRQFVGTTLALILEDFGDRLPAELATRVLAAIRTATVGEPEGRIPVAYTNPALMRAWLDAWTGSRVGDPQLLERGEAFARRIVERFERIGTFDEFNSPTYAGIDLYALALWQTLGPTPLFRDEGRRLAHAVWSELADFFVPSLRNWCGPFTRSYHPDATRSIAKAGLWFWAEAGRDAAPVAPLVPAVDHGHDLASGPVIARLHEPVADALPGGLDRPDRRVQEVTIGDRRIVASITPELAIGTESSPNDWGGWAQFLPVTAHWGGDDGVEIIWLAAPHRIEAEITGDRTVRVTHDRPIRFWLQADSARPVGSTLSTPGAALGFSARPAEVAAVSGERFAVALDDDVRTVEIEIEIG